MGVRNCAEFGTVLQKIALKLVENQDLCKLLYYTDDDPLAGATVPSSTIFGDYIKIIPKVKDDEEKNTVVLLLKNADKDSSNDEFKNISLFVYVYTPLTQWIIDDDDHNLRPFKILGEIQKTLYKKRVGGIGVLTGGDFELDLLTTEMSCYVLEFNLDVFA